MDINSRITKDRAVLTDALNDAASDIKKALLLMDTNAEAIPFNDIRNLLNDTQSAYYYVARLSILTILKYETHEN